MPARQHAFSQDNTSKEALYASLETIANLPSSPISRFNASCMRKSRPTNGLNVGIVYITKTHLIFFAHFVSTSPNEQRISLPLRRIVHVRRCWYGRLLPHGMLVRCKGFPDYLIVLCSKDEQKEALSMVQSVVVDAKDLDSDESVSEYDEEVPVELPKSSHDHPTRQLDLSEPELERGRVTTLRKVRTVKFAPPHHLVEEYPIVTESDHHLKDHHVDVDVKVDGPVSPLKGLMEKAISTVQNTAVHERQTETFVFCVSAFVLMFTTVGVCVALHLLQLRISIIANHLQG